jgi:hypothetical protein
MESKEIFAIALNIVEPWYIKEVTMERQDNNLFGQVDIYIDFRVGSRFIDTLGE